MNTTPLSHNHLKILKKLRLKKYRDRAGLFIAEGVNALEEALLGNRYPVREIIVSHDFLESGEGAEFSRKISNDITVYSCSRRTVEELSTEEAPRGVLLVCGAKTRSLNDLEKTPPDRLLYLEGVADPGNLGTILRTALWFGMRHLLLGPSCADPFNPKTVRATAGALFGVSLYRPVPAETLASFARNAGYKLAATTPRGDLPVAEWRQEERYILLLGGEARGLSNELLEAADAMLSIPGCGAAESLNVAAAAAILLYELGGNQRK
ncbi:MAG TPA: RNA methyltransferase [Deltaproteobacteria bacterium]|nr:RNA methyltransferase [Deltaproteobacteria bacterium]